MIIHMDYVAACSRFLSLLYLIIILRPIGTAAQQFQPCSTADNRPGVCVYLQNCDALRAAYQQPTYYTEFVAIVDYVRRSLCGFDGASLMVCCSGSTSTGYSPAALQMYSPFTFVPLQPIGAPTAGPTAAPSIVSLPPAAIVTNVIAATTPSLPAFPPNLGLAPTVAAPVAVGQTPLPSLPPKTGNLLDQVCGISNFTQTRVVGGTYAKLNAYPWIALLAYQLNTGDAPKFLCAGSLISVRYVITTAHCINEQLQFVRLGEYDLASDTDGAYPLDVPIEQRILHEGYVANLILNDIALLRLAIQVPISAAIRPICLPSPPLLDADLTGYQPFLAGWGSVSYQGASPSILQEAQIPIVSNADCQTNYRALFPQQSFDDRVLCAGTGGRDACQGDSGGPLMLPRQLAEASTFYYVLIGLVSYGYECAREGFPGVYTRVAAFIPWIQSHMVA